MELKESKLEMDNSVNKEIRDLPKDIEEKSMQCTSNFEDHSFYNVEDQTEKNSSGEDASNKNEIDEEDDEVDIVECTGFNEIEVSECNDGTEMYSSSFSGTVSEHENETSLNDQEADSMISTGTFWIGKKKITDHWRRFTQPIIWRCKWIELKIKEVQNQAQMYDKELQESCQAKQLELENLKSEEHGVKALPSLPCDTQKTRFKKRKTRKRVEEESDVSSYALNHNLFSFYEYRKSFADIALNDNLDKKNKICKEETPPPLEFREGDAYLEQILLKIEAAKLEAHNLQNRVEKMMNENPSRFSSVNSLNLLGSAEDEKSVISEEKPDQSASIPSHHDTPEDDETTDILLSEILSSRQREGKAIVPDKKLQTTKQTSVEESPSRKRTPRNRDVMTKEETTTTTPKRRRVSREKSKSNVMMTSRLKLPNKKRKQGKRRSNSVDFRTVI